jgi:uncharacterized membrane protein YphA (DoxX/SURF4 family)
MINGIDDALILPVAFAVAVGAFTRPSAALMVLYALGTALIGHRYWTVKGADFAELGRLLQRPRHYEKNDEIASLILEFLVKHSL